MSLRRVSAAWNHFDKIENNKVKCGLCGSILAYAGSTSSMLAHLHKKHSTIMAVTTTADVTTTASFKFDGDGQMNLSSDFTLNAVNSDARSQLISALLAEMLVTDLLQPTVVEGEGFSKLIAFLEPQYSLPSFHCIMRQVRELYDEVKSRTHQSLDQVFYVTLTTDIWTSLMFGESYMTVTSHWLDRNWSPQSAVLQTVELKDKHSFLTLSSHLNDIRHDWRLSDKVVATVHSSKILVTGDLDIFCSAHSLHMAVDEGLKIIEIQTIIKVVSGLVSYIRKSTVATDALQSAQNCLHLPRHDLIQFESSRWDVYEMLERITEQKHAVTVVLSDRNIMKSKTADSIGLSTSQWNLIDSLLPTLKYLQITATLISGESHDSLLSTVLPLVSGLIRRLQPESDDMPAVKQFKSIVSEQLQNKFMSTLDENDSRICAAIVDPRYKGLKFLDDDFRQRAYDAFRRHLGPSKDSISEEPSKKIMKDSSSLRLLLGEQYFIETQETQDELDSYLKAPSLSPDCDPFIWWKENYIRFPTLSNIARHYLSCPAAAVPTSSATLKATTFVDKRNCLSPEHIDTFIFLNKNFFKKLE